MITTQQRHQWTKDVSDAYKRGFTDGAIEAKKVQPKAEPVSLLMPPTSAPSDGPKVIDMSRLPRMHVQEAYKMAKALADHLATAPAPEIAQTKSEPVQEPVAWYHGDYGHIELSRVQRVGWKPLYAAAPQAKPLPLTDEQIEAVWVEHGLDDCDPQGFARAIEAAHGIGGGK